RTVDVKAGKNAMPLTFANGTNGKLNALAAPGAMSFTITVPASVPSLFHSSAPLAGVDALKNSVPLMLVMLRGNALAAPAPISFTSTVPAAVPSLFHTSVPSAACDAAQPRLHLQVGNPACHHAAAHRLRPPHL